MGVPAFFKWLTVRYPQVVIDAISEEDLQYLYSEYEGRKKSRRERDNNEIDINEGQQDNGEIDPAVLI